MARLICLAFCFLLTPVAAGAESPDCEGRNPLHCGKEAEERAEAHVDSDPDVLIMPPGGCEGRNPRYCRETEPEVEETKVEPPRRSRRNADNTSRNPNRNPNANPNRNPRRRGGE